jgi:hypothetical protein
MVGFDDKNKSYRLYESISKKIILNRDVQFDENLIGFKHLKLPESLPEIPFPLSLSDNHLASQAGEPNNHGTPTSTLDEEITMNIVPPSLESEPEGVSLSPRVVCACVRPSRPSRPIRFMSVR